MFAVFVCLLPLAGALPTNYAQNISLAYVGDAISNLDTVNAMNVADPAMADPLKDAIAAAWPDYYSHLVNPDEPTTTMSPEDAAWFAQTNLVNFWVDFHNETGSAVITQPGGPLLSPAIGENGTTVSNATLEGAVTDPLGVSNSSGVVDESSIVTVSPIETDLLNSTVGPTGDVNIDGLNGTLPSNGSFPILRDSIADQLGQDDHNTTIDPLMPALDHLNDSSIALDHADHLNDTSITLDHALDDTGSTVATHLESSDPLAVDGTTLVPHLEDGSTTPHLLDDGTVTSTDHPLDDHPLEDGTSPMAGDATATVVPMVDGAVADSGTTIPHDGALMDPAEGHTTTMGIPASF